MPLIPLALALADFAPTILRYFGAGEKSASVAEKVIDVAKVITGTESGEAAIESLKANPELVMQFRLQLVSMENDLEKAFLADVSSARARDTEISKSGNHNYRADTMYGLAVLVIGVLVYSVLQSELDEYGKGIITLVLGRFLGYLDNIYNFEFGSTRASKTKDDTINSMSKGGN